MSKMVKKYTILPVLVTCIAQKQIFMVNIDFSNIFKTCDHLKLGTWGVTFQGGLVGDRKHTEIGQKLCHSSSFGNISFISIFKV